MKSLLATFFLLLTVLPLPAAEINHVVICWYEESVDSQTVENAMQAIADFKQIPGILSVKVGRPVPSDRDIVDDTFSLGVYILAKDQASLDAYLIHPIHKAFVENFVKGKAQRVTVYDF